MNEGPEGKALKYKVTVKGPGVSIDRQVEQDTALAVIASVFGRFSGTPGAAETIGRPNVASGPQVSVGEFVAASKAKRNPEKIAAIGGYLTQRGQKFFTRDEIKKLFSAAGERVPANYARDFAWAVESKWIAEDPLAGYYMTSTGLQAVAQEFPDEIRKSTRQKTAKRRRPRRKAPGATE